MAGFSAVMVINGTPALAGFDWLPPAGTPSAAAPAAPQGSINWNKTVPQMPAQKVQSIEAVPLTSAEKKKMPPVVSSDVVSGFGTDLPLMVALQQVVPSQYKVSLAPGINPDTHVSWKGDKPWEQALSDMLAPPGFVFSIQGNVLIVKSSAANKSSTAPVVAARSKADMIPEDMVSDNTKKEASLSAPVTPTKPISMTIRRTKSAPVQEAEVAPVAALPATPAASDAPAAVSSNAAAQTVIQPAWHAVKGQTLRSVLENWSEEAHVQLYWSTDYDYRLGGDISYGGSFEEAVGRLFDQFSAAKPQPYGQLHKNPETAAVLVVNTYGTSN